MTDVDFTKNIVRAFVTTESGCNVDDGEYNISIQQFIGEIGSDDVELVAEAITECVDDLELPYEWITEVMLIETGKREDVFWHKYYQVVAHEHIIVHQRTAND